MNQKGLLEGIIRVKTKAEFTSLAYALVFDLAPPICPKCLEPYVVPGHSSISEEPVWYCDNQECAIIISWRRTEQAIAKG